MSGMNRIRVNVLTAVNSANVSRSGDVYTVRDVVHAVDGIVLNRRLYPGKELQRAASGLNGVPAPAGHPKDSKGRHISATNGEALAASWVGAYCTNARYEGGRALCDVVINAEQARAMSKGRDLLSRLDAAIDGSSTEPINVSSGLYLREVAANGESLGKAYNSVATDMQFDHLAILLDEVPAGTPAEGIGMFVNADGSESAVESAQLDQTPADRRHTGLLGWVRRLLGNASELSFDQISDVVRAALPDGAWPIEIYARHLVWADRDNRLWRQDYSLSSDGATATLTSDPAEVARRVDYLPIATNSHKDQDPMKDHILAALGAAGVSAEGKSDAQLLQAYNALVSSSAAAPLQAQLTAVNAELQKHKDAAALVENAKREELVKALATNGALTADDLRLLPVATLERIAAASKGAAPLLTGNAGTGADEFAGYDINKL